MEGCGYNARLKAHDACLAPEVVARSMTPWQKMNVVTLTGWEWEGDLEVVFEGLRVGADVSGFSGGGEAEGLVEVGGDGVGVIDPELEVGGVFGGGPVAGGLDEGGGEAFAAVEGIDPEGGHVGAVGDFIAEEAQGFGAGGVFIVNDEVADAAVAPGGDFAGAFSGEVVPEGVGSGEFFGEGLGAAEGVGGFFDGAEGELFEEGAVGGLDGAELHGGFQSYK